MNGAEAILRTLAGAGVEVCFANPGTSEMQMVSAFDRAPEVRPVLCLFEGVATGAADGYGRMAEGPAATLLHLGPGLSNGAANLHNARRAFTPIVNLIGDHATYHQRYDAPLASDIESLARPHSVWVKSAGTADEAARLAAEAVVESLGPPGGIASLILPADCAWSPAEGVGPVLPRPRRQPAPREAVDRVALRLHGARKPVLLLGGEACRERGLDAAARLSAAGMRVMLDTFVSRLPRGAGRFQPDRLPYFGEMALSDLEGVDLMLTVETRAPVAFFAYPDAPSVLVPDGCEVMALARQGEDGAAAMADLADGMGAPKHGPAAELSLPNAVSGPLNAYTVGQAIARSLPEHAVVCDDGVTAGLPIYLQTRGARAHDWLMLTGGAIGAGIPLAIGAAVARPDSKVVSLNGDGAAAYTVQGLWTIAREGLDVVAIVFANHAYRILNIELARTKAGDPGPKARELLDLGDPRIDWVQVAQGFGVPAERCASAEAFDQAFQRAMETPGPAFIEVALI